MVRERSAQAAAGWMVSPSFDWAWVLGPALAAGLAAPLLPAGVSLPLWAWVLVVVGIDVTHVYGTLYRVYLDPNELRRRLPLYLGTPVAVAAGCAGVHALAPSRFWTLMAYLAVWHFVRQAVGIGVLYRARSGQRTRDLGGRAERSALYAVTVAPVVWWHAHLPLPFEWFVPGDFIGPIAQWLLWPTTAVAAVALAAHFTLRLRSGVWAPGSDLWLGTTAVVWVGGIVLARSDAGFTLSNVIAHGVPYLALVQVVGRRRWQRAGAGPARRSWFSASGLPWLLLPLVVLATVEEGLWDALVWHDHPELFGSWSVPSWASWVALVLLAVPQVTHYVLDGFIWKLGPTNPGLAEDLSISR